MTRNEALALYRPIRASMRRILSLAVPVCSRVAALGPSRSPGPLHRVSETRCMRRLVILFAQAENWSGAAGRGLAHVLAIPADVRLKFELATINADENAA